ncbi:Repeat domain-containing protein [Candidatus Fervidibacteria bacterium JGI MDM2 SSWTFF-3-K9]
MGKRLLFFAIIFVSLFAFTLWRAQPPFRLRRKLLAKLPYSPDKLLVTDLDDDGHPEVMAVKEDEPLIWVRFPFDKPSLLRFENCQSIRVWVLSYSSVLKALPVLTADKRLRLLRWKGKASFEPLPAFPDVPIDRALIDEGEGTGTVFLWVRRGKDVWVFTLTSQGHWQFASRFTNRFQSVWGWDIADLADLDRNGKLDALCKEQWHPVESTWVLWGGRKERKTFLGVWVHSGSPQIADLDGDGWMEIVMVDEYGRLKIWRFDRRERRLKVIATSPPLPVTWGDFSMRLFDLDGDGQKEIVVVDVNRNFWVFRWRDGKLKMWQKMWQGKTDLDMWHLTQVKFGDRLALYTYQYHPIWLLPPRICLEGRKLRWRFREEASFTFFALLPKGKQALLPSNWRIYEAPFQLKFAGDIDGDGSDEVVGYDGRWRRWRLYRAEVTKSGELRWRDVLLGREKIEPTAFALLVDGKRRGLVVAWSDGRLELLTMEGRR